MSNRKSEKPRSLKICLMMSSGFFSWKISQSVSSVSSQVHGRRTSVVERVFVAKADEIDGRADALEDGHVRAVGDLDMAALADDLRRIDRAFIGVQEAVDLPFEIFAKAFNSFKFYRNENVRAQR